jgi:hypothetical protein
MSHLSISAVRADALFASALQPSAEPSVMQIRQAIAEAIGRYGGRGCSARVAQAYGDHPDAAATRRRWARTAVTATFGGSRPQPAPPGRPAGPRRPAPPVPREPRPTPRGPGKPISSSARHTPVMPAIEMTPESSLLVKRVLQPSVLLSIRGFGVRAFGGALHEPASQFDAAEPQRTSARSQPEQGMSPTPPTEACAPEWKRLPGVDPPVSAGELPNEW